MLIPSAFTEGQHRNRMKEQASPLNAPKTKRLDWFSCMLQLFLLTRNNQQLGFLLIALCFSMWEGLWWVHTWYSKPSLFFSRFKKIESCPSSRFLKSQNFGCMVHPSFFVSTRTWELGFSSLLHCGMLRGEGVESGCQNFPSCLNAAVFTLTWDAGTS